MRSVSRNTERERGAAMVEFAILLPLFLLIIGGIVDFGRAFFTQIELTNAAREGARAAAISTATLGQVQDRVDASTPGLTTVAALETSCPADAFARVSVTSDFEWIILGPALSLLNGGGGFAPPPTLSAEAAMKCGG